MREGERRRDGIEVDAEDRSLGALKSFHPQESAADPYKLSVALSVTWPPQSLLIFRYWEVSW